MEGDAGNEEDTAAAGATTTPNTLSRFWRCSPPAQQSSAETDSQSPLIRAQHAMRSVAEFDQPLHNATWLTDIISSTANANTRLVTISTSQACGSRTGLSNPCRSVSRR